MHATSVVEQSPRGPVGSGATIHTVWRTSLRFTLLTTLLFGVAYPLFVTGVSGAMFPRKAGGSLIVRDGQTIGSELIAQSFISDRYFQPRPSAAGNGYDPTSSGGSNLAQSNAKLVQRMQGDINRLSSSNGGAAVPIDAVTTSGSGLDPEITPDNAYFQAPRVARARGLTEQQVRQLIQKQTSGRTFGIFGEPRVNVLDLNLMLDQLSK